MLNTGDVKKLRKIIGWVDKSKNASCYYYQLLGVDCTHCPLYTSSNKLLGCALPDVICLTVV